MTIFLIAHYVDYLESLLVYVLKREGLDVVISDDVSHVCRLARKKKAYYIVKLNYSNGISDTERLKELKKEFPSIRVFGVIKHDANNELEKYYTRCGVDHIYTYPRDWYEIIRVITDFTKRNTSNHVRKRGIFPVSAIQER